MTLRCTDTVPCDAHRDGAARADDKCPGICDAPGCTDDVAGDEYCIGHWVLDEAGARLDEMAMASRKADRYGVTLARLLREAVRMVPLALAVGVIVGALGCATAPAAPVAPETVGQLAPAAYGHSVSAPVHHDAPPEFGGVVGSDDDSVSETVTTVTRAPDARVDGVTGDAAELPEVAPKTDGVTTGTVRQ